MTRTAIGSLIGAAAGAAIAPFVKPLFHVPAGGVGMITVSGYPKSWDYAVIALLVLGAFAGGAIAAKRTIDETREARVRGRVITAIAVFVVMWFVHDHPFAIMDPFHEGEHLTAGWLMKSGARPYRDFYIFHGLAADAGLDALTLGDPPSPLGPRRLQNVLDAATLALLVPIAAELTVTTAGMIAAVFVSLCACAAFWLPVFPYYRLAPLLLAVWALLVFARKRSDLALFAAFAASTLGVLWSLDIGLFAVAGTLACAVLLRPKPLRAAILALVALALPLLVLVAVRADLHRFFVDSFVVMPKAIDPIWALPAPAPFTANGIRYFLPPVFYGFALALAWMYRGNKVLAVRIAVIAVFSILLFRAAAGRVSWSHTRFAVPLLGIAVVAFVLEPLIVRKRVLAAVLVAVPLFFYFEIRENVVAGAKLLAEWHSRQSHEGLVPYPLEPGRGIYTTADNARDLAALNEAINNLGPHDAPIFDFSNERALYYLLQRRSPTRCLEVSMLSVPRMLADAMGELNANPPLCVIVSGYPEIASFDGVSNRDRVPELAQWIDANYPKRVKIGRFELAMRP